VTTKVFFEEDPVPRVPNEVIERLKDEVDLARLVARSGVVLKRTGKDLVGRCPFHDDDTPSLVVTPDNGLWHCMGACQAGGTVIDWVMRAQGVSFRHAVELLRAGAPVVTGGRVGAAKSSTVRRLPPPVDVDAGDQELLDGVVAYYHRTLLDSPEAMSYLARRKIDHPEATETFGLGFSNRTLGLHLPDKRRREGAAIRGRLTRLGVYRESGHEHLAGSLVVPVTDPAGRTTDLYGRKITPGLRAGTPLHLYLPGPHKGVWNEAGLAEGEVIVAESLIDALTLWCWGFTNVTAAFGTAGFTPAHHTALARHRVTRVLLAYDHDRAGDRAAEDLARDLMGAGIECFRVQLPVGADVNDVAVSSKNPRDALGKAVREAVWMGRGKQAPGTGPQHRRQAVPAAPPSAAPSAEPPATPEISPGGVPVPLVSPVPEPPVLPAAALSHDELVLVIGEHRWRVRHLPKRPGPGTLRVTVMVQRAERFHIDTLDLYVARQRSAFCDSAATEIRATRDVLGREIGRVLLSVEEAVAGASTKDPGTPVPVGEERDRALRLLESTDLLAQVSEAFGVLGVVGEEHGALVAWLTLTSRLSDRPLGAVIQSSSSAGKSTLADAALALVPGEATVSYSAMTGQALYYLGETDLSHKVLAIAEEQGASRATYALKLLVSEGRLAIAAAGKDPVTGRLTTHTYEVTGPVALLMTTTAAELDEELANRLLVVSVTESRAQTRAVQAAQRTAETLDGLIARSKRADLIALHHAAQRLLAPIAVVNPHAPSLGFSDRATRHRRDNAKLLALIRAVTLSHQHQRPRHQVTVGGRTVTYIESTERDVATAERLADRLMSATTDELSPATRRLLDATCAFVADRGTEPFTRRELRAATGTGDTQLKVHLARLVDLEYVIARGAGPATVYELAPGYDPDRSDTGADRSGAQSDPSGIGRGEDPDRSDIGRVGRHRSVTVNPEISEPNGTDVPDRSGESPLRIVGAGVPVAHVGA
jgi:hypothetical protein